MPRSESLVSRLRYASQVIQIRPHYLPSGDDRPFQVIQVNTITFEDFLLPFCGPYTILLLMET